MIAKWIRKVKAAVTPMRFATTPRNLIVEAPTHIRGARRIHMGDDVYIGRNSMIRAVTKTGHRNVDPRGRHKIQEHDSRIFIGDRVWITEGMHLAAHRLVSVEDEVMFAGNVFISDAMHCFDKGNVPYMYQGMSEPRPILIKQGSWIGQNAVILPGVTIGEYAIVGANSVVTRSIPKQCIAAGAPARVIKRWNEERQSWERLNGDPGEVSTDFPVGSRRYE